VLVSEFDGLVGTVVGGLKKYGFWEHTLLLVHTDNGGEMVFSDACASAAAWARVQSSSASLSSSLSSSLSTSSAENKDEVGEELASDKAGAETAAGQEETGVRAKEAGEARIAAAPSGVGFRGGAASNGALRGGKFTLWQV
jgi:arylsulfatase A-like enzyme